MGCSVSKPRRENNAAAMVSICRERKRLMKLAIRRRHALAIAQFKYNQSLLSVASVIRAFGEKKQTQLVITDPIPERETEEESDEEREICEHFYDDNNNDDDAIGVPLMQNVVESEDNGYGWDFFNLFDEWKTEVVNNVYGGERKVKQGNLKEKGDAKMNQGPIKAKTELEGKELLEAMKEIGESFVKGSECGVEVSRMLEVSAVHHLESGLDKFQENPMKSPFQSVSPMKNPFQSITWGRSTSSSSSSSRSFFAFSSPCSSVWTEANNDYLDELKGMVSGSHSLTLGRLYAWECKLYEEVKVGEYSKKIYQQKCWQLKNQDAKCKGLSSPEKIKAEVRELYSRILVSIRRVESISEKIRKLKDEELHPQLVELLSGLMNTWKIMLETHKAQKEAISEVKKFTGFCNESHRLTTFQIQTEVQNWCFCFAEYLSAQKAYVEALNGWLSKSVSSQVKSHGIGKFLGLPSNDDPPSVFITREWLNLLYDLPEKHVTCAMKSLGKDMRVLWAQQGDEQLQKRKVDGLTKEIDKIVNALKREEGKKVENVAYRLEYLNERKHLLDDLRKKIEIEKEQQRGCMEETQRDTLRVFKSGFGSVFDSLIEFSKGSLRMYADLVAESEKKGHK